MFPSPPPLPSPSPHPLQKALIIIILKFPIKNSANVIENDDFVIFSSR
jgi:hypothetical protein